MERLTREEQDENNVDYWCYKHKRSVSPRPVSVSVSLLLPYLSSDNVDKQ